MLRIVPWLPPLFEDRAAGGRALATSVAETALENPIVVGVEAPWPRFWTEDTYQRLVYPVGWGSAWVVPFANCVQLTVIEKGVTSPAARAFACAASIQ